MISELVILIHKKTATWITMSFIIILLGVHGAENTVDAQLLGPFLPLESSRGVSVRDVQRRVVIFRWFHLFYFGFLILIGLLYGCFLADEVLGAGIRILCLLKIWNILLPKQYIIKRIRLIYQIELRLLVRTIERRIQRTLPKSNPSFYFHAFSELGL